MKGALGFAYSIIAFLTGAEANLYLLGFLGNLIVPRSIDSGPPAFGDRYREYRRETPMLVPGLG